MNHRPDRPLLRPAARRRANAGALAIAMTLGWTGLAGADIRSQLGPGVSERCPTQDDIEARWRARASAAAAIELYIVAEGDRLVGIVRAAPEGQPPVARRLRARRGGCSALVDALLTSAALLVAPLELPPAPPPPEPEPLPEPAPEPPRPLPGGGPWRIAVGVRADTGLAPGATVLGEARLIHRWPSFALALGLQGGATGDSGVGAGAVSTERYAARLDGCWRPRSLGLCGFARGGVLALRPSGLDGQDALEALLDLGVRGAWYVELADGWSLVADVEAALPSRPLQLTVDGEAAWQAAVVSVGGGLAVQWAP